MTEIIFQYKTDIKHIDEQHERLLDIVEILIKDIRRGATIQTIYETIDFLEKYMITHFKDEEKLMRKNNYPGLEEHKKHHQIMIGKIEVFKKDFIESINMNTEDKMAQEMLDFITNWIMKHILEEDLYYVPFIKD